MRFSKSSRLEDSNGRLSVISEPLMSCTCVTPSRDQPPSLPDCARRQVRRLYLLLVLVRGHHDEREYSVRYQWLPAVLLIDSYIQILLAHVLNLSANVLVHR